MAYDPKRFLANRIRKQRQQLAIVALATGKTITAAAQAAGVSRWSIYDWLKQPAFRAELVQAAKEQAVFTRNGLDAIAFATEAYVTDILHKAHTQQKRVLALQRIVNLYDRMEYRVNRRLGYAERFSASHTTSSARPEPETQPIVDEPTESEAEPPNRRIA